MREFRQAFWQAHPSWTKLYILLVGVPAWAVMFYQVAIAESPDSVAFEIALAVFGSAALLQIAIFFWATSRCDL